MSLHRSRLREDLEMKKMTEDLRFGDVVRNPVTGSVGMFIAAARKGSAMDVLVLATDPDMTVARTWNGKVKRVFEWQKVDE